MDFYLIDYNLIQIVLAWSMHPTVAHPYDGHMISYPLCQKQAMLWHADGLKLKSTLEEHSSIITDVRFSPSMPRLATSSFDKTVRVWDADNVRKNIYHL